MMNESSSPPQKFSFFSLPQRLIDHQSPSMAHISEHCSSLLDEKLKYFDRCPFCEEMRTHGEFAAFLLKIHCLQYHPIATIRSVFPKFVEEGKKREEEKGNYTDNEEINNSTSDLMSTPVAAATRRCEVWEKLNLY
jgi:hypothetical protein